MRRIAPSRAFAWTSGAALLIAVAGAVVAEVDVVAVAEGRVIPSARVKRIQAFESGIVRAVHVEDGQSVRAGDILVELDPTVRGAERERLSHALRWSGLDAARLSAMRHSAREAEARFAPPAEASAAETEIHRGMMMAELLGHEAKLRELDFAILRGEAQNDALRASILKADRALPLLRERVAARGRLAELGHGSRLQYLELAQQLVELEQQADALRVQLDAGLAQTESQRAERERLDADFRRRVLSRLIEAQRARQTAVEDLRKAEQQPRHQTLAAPIDGKVQQLAANTIGGVAAAGEVLMIVVPDHDRLEIEAMVQNRDIGFVRAGQRAILKFESFPYTIYGTMDGMVKDVSRDAVDDPRLGPVYAVRIAPAADRMTVAGREIALTAGMKATIDIVTDRRRVMDFVLSPLLRVAQESLRER